jgi:hypothetical protein
MLLRKFKNHSKHRFSILVLKNPRIQRRREAKIKEMGTQEERLKELRQFAPEVMCSRGIVADLNN